MRSFKRLFTAFTTTAALALAAVAGMGTASPASAAEPIRIGVIAPSAHVAGRSILQAAELAVDNINSNGGIDGRQVKLFKYDSHFQAADAVRAFQRAVQQDHVVAMTGVFISEVGLSLQPWAARLQTPLIITGAASTKLDTNVHSNYSQLKYNFHQFTNSTTIGRIACDFAHDVLVGELGFKKAAIFAEDAAWTKPLVKEYKQCLPKSGMKLVDSIVFSPDTSDFRPLFNQVKQENPDVLITAIAHVGVKPTVQWRQQQVPVLLAGANGQGGSTAFWNNTNGAAEGVIVGTTGAAGAPVSEKTPEFFKSYQKRFGEAPAYDSYTEYDAIHVLKQAIERAGGDTSADKLVSSLEKTDYTGVAGPISFYGKDDEFTHGLVYDSNRGAGVYFQWQNEKQVPVWPKYLANDNKVKLPSFVKSGGQ